MSRRLVGVVVLAVAGAVMGGCATPSQMIADHRMEEMCAKDGGSIVYATATLPDEFFSATGTVKNYTSMPGTYDLGFGFYLKNTEKVIYGHASSANVTRTEIEVWRRNDNFLMGRKIYYLRSGGDFPVGTFEPSANMCPPPASKFPFFPLTVFKHGDKHDQ